MGQGSRNRAYAETGGGGYTELGCSKWKKGNGFSKPNFERGPKHHQAHMWSSIQHDPKIKATYERLLAAGKPKNACMRKQLTILNTMMKNGTHWNGKLA